MTKWKHTAILECFLQDEHHAFNRQDIIRITGLSSSYIGTYLTRFTDRGILRYRPETHDYILLNRDKAMQSIVKDVLVTEASPTTSPPSLIMPRTQHRERLIGTIWLTEDVVDPFRHYKEQHPDCHWIRYSGPGDRARRLIVEREHIKVVIAQPTLYAQVYILTGHEGQDWLEEMDTWFGDNAAAQAEMLEAEADVEIAVRQGFAFAAKKAGHATISLEVRGSQFPEMMIEAHKVNTRHIRLMEAQFMHDGFQGLLAIPHIMDDLVLLKDKVKTMEAKVDVLVVTVSSLTSTASSLMQSQATVVDAVTKLTETISKTLTKEQPYQSQETEDSGRGYR